MSLTPHGGGFYPRSDCWRGLTADDVADVRVTKMCLPHWPAFHNITVYKDRVAVNSFCTTDLVTLLSSMLLRCFKNSSTSSIKFLTHKRKCRKNKRNLKQKLNELAQWAETSSSSPDSKGRKKCRITRELTVNECHCIVIIMVSFNCLMYLLEKSCYCLW